MAISVTNSANFIEILFQTWLTELPKFSLESEMKRSLLGLTAILTIDPKDQNKLIIQNIKLILEGIFSLACTLDQKKEKKLIKGAKNLDEEQELDDDAREEELNENLKKAQQSILGNGNADEELFVDEEDEEEDEEWDEFEELNNMTTLDMIDEILAIKEAFSYISQSFPAYYQELMNFIDDQSKSKLETYVKNAEARAALKK